MAVGPRADAPAERRGRVVDERGAPVPDAVVSIVESTVPMPEIALLCDAGGRFSLRLPSGRFTFRAHAGARRGDAGAEAPGDDEIVIVVG